MRTNVHCTVRFSLRYQCFSWPRLLDATRWCIRSVDTDYGPHTQQNFHHYTFNYFCFHPLFHLASYLIILGLPLNLLFIRNLVVLTAIRFVSFFPDDALRQNCYEQPTITTW